MKKYIYPVIVFEANDNSYTVLFPDLDIVASGDTVEEAYKYAEDYLESYLEFAGKMENKIAEPTSFVDTQKLNPKRLVMLADALAKDSYQLTDGEEKYKNFLKNLVTTSEE